MELNWMYECELKRGVCTWHTNNIIRPVKLISKFHRNHSKPKTSMLLQLYAIFLEYRVITDGCFNS